MKYKRMALAACALLLLLSATNLSAVLTDEHPRYHQHLERPAYTPCAEHDGEDLLCSHLPLVLIDTGGEAIPGVPIRDGGQEHRSNDTLHHYRGRQYAAARVRLGGGSRRGQQSPRRRADAAERH